MEYTPSKLVPLGLVLLASFFILSVGLRVADQLLGPTEHFSPAQLMLVGLAKIIAGLSEILFLVGGLSCTVIGALRNRKARREAAVGTEPS
jgi:uncharacterized membrane protein YfcA